MVNNELIRRTFTLTKHEDEMLEEIIRHRHPTDFRVDSQTVRELIREEFDRIQKLRKARGTA